MEVPFRCGFEYDWCELDPGIYPHLWRRGTIETVHHYETGPVSAYEGRYYIYTDGTYRAYSSRYIYIHVYMFWYQTQQVKYRLSQN